MNVLLSFNDMFKWRGPWNIKWDSPFGYPNHILLGTIMCSLILETLDPIGL
jgi:hypothetical protein